MNLTATVTGRHGGLHAVDLARLAGWKAWQAGRLRLGAHGGYRRLEQRGLRWAEWWAREHGDLAPWLLREGAGSFWIPATGTPEWCRSTCTPEDMQLADARVAGYIDLLGSGPVRVGARPTWRHDLYDGTLWPLTPAHRTPLVRAGSSDIRTVWEMSRCYHFTALARAYWKTGDAAYRDTFVADVESWLGHNPLGFGPNWASPMDAGLRAANWIVALLIFSEAEDIPRSFWRRMLANLFSTGLFLERHLEWHPVYRGNHYVSNGVGLVYLGTLFRDAPEGARWLRRGARILNREIVRQVHPDGASFEASLAYHRLVTEFFAYGGDLVRLNLPEALDDAYEGRLRGMYRFIDSYLPSTDEAPMLGDADDGRLHAVSAAALGAPRHHRLGLPERYWPETPPGSAAFPDGGFYVLRSGTDHAVVRCGPVGIKGAGSHDHNDQLSLELVVGGRRIVADSGTYAYTRDLAQRFAFRSTAAHSVVQVGDEEQNRITPERPWRILEERTHAACVAWNVSPNHILFAGRHLGYRHRPSGAICHRRITADLTTATPVWHLLDEVRGRGAERVTWRLHLADCEVEDEGSSGDVHTFLLPGSPAVRIGLRVPDDFIVSVTTSPISNRYGVRYTRPCLTASGTVRLPFRIETTITSSS